MKTAVLTIGNEDAGCGAGVEPLTYIVTVCWRVRFVIRWVGWSERAMRVIMSAYFTSYVHVSHHPLIPTSLLQPICISHGLRAIGRGISGQIPLILAQMASVISLSHTIYLHISWSTLSWSF